MYYFLLILILTDCLPKSYYFKNDPIDVVIPCHKKDLETLNLCIKYLKLNVQKLRRIIVVSSEKLTDQAEWIDELIYPFDKRAIAYEIFNNKEIADNYLANPNNRLGWILQQIIKLYSLKIIPNISSNVLIMDADTVLLKSHKFINRKGGGIFTTSGQYYKPYFDHAERLIPGFKKIYAEYSGISHHLLFQKSVMDDLHAIIENEHKMETWKAICKCIDINELIISGCPMSEYEIYFNYALSQSDQFSVRQLKMAEDHRIQLQKYLKNNTDMVSFHYWMRTRLSIIR